MRWKVFVKMKGQLLIYLERKEIFLYHSVCAFCLWCSGKLLNSLNSGSKQRKVCKDLRDKTKETFLFFFYNAADKVTWLNLDFFKQRNHRATSGSAGFMVWDKEGWVSSSSITAPVEGRVKVTGACWTLHLSKTCPWCVGSLFLLGVCEISVRSVISVWAHFGNCRRQLSCSDSVFAPLHKTPWTADLRPLTMSLFLSCLLKLFSFLWSS